MTELQTKENNSRISSIDAARGLVMMVMALDHVRDFMHVASLTQDPTNLQTTTAALFITRWVTHLCAPTFVFLSGVSAYLFYNSSPDSSRKIFLFSRGLWLMFIDLTVINFALWFDVQLHTVIMEVVFAIGFGLMVISLLLKLPARAIGLAGILIIFGHNLLQGVSFKNSPVLDFIFAVFFRQSLFTPKPGFAFITAYPLLPWLGVILTGFSFGQIFKLPEPVRKKRFLQIAASVFCLFILIRGLNFYGDPLPWSVQKNALFTFLSFINVTKYPPSLLFILLMLNVLFIVLWLAEGKNNPLVKVLRVYGKVPLFYFVLHLYLIHLLTLLMIFVEGHTFADLKFGLLRNGRPEGTGVDLGTVYLIWIAVVLFLFPICKWYGKYKQKHRGNRILQYL